MGVTVMTNVELPNGTKVEAGISSVGGLHIEYPNGKGWTIQSDGKITDAILRDKDGVKHVGEGGIPLNPRALYLDASAVLKQFSDNAQKNDLQPFQVQKIEILQKAINDKLASSSPKPQVAKL